MQKEENSFLGTLWYFGDPMCSWCYGISDEILAIKKHYKDTLGFRLVMGGLRPEGGEEWNVEFKKFLKNHWSHVNMSSGKEFNTGILEWDEFDYNTEPSCRAVVVFRFMYPDLAMEFLAKVSKRFYVDNQDPKEDEFYKPIFEEMDLDFASFKVLFHSQKFKKETFDDFMKAKNNGVLGFPTLLFEHRRRFTVITRGFNIAGRLQERIDEAIVRAKRIDNEKRGING